MDTDNHAKFLQDMISPLLEYPEEIKVVGKVDEMGVLLTVAVHKDDMGRVIGRSGDTAKAFRTILRAYGMKHQARINMKVLEPNDSTD